MDKEFTPYKEALDLKELGFDGECLGYFDDKGLFYYTSNPWDATSEKGMMDKPTSVPLYQQAFRWFRDKHNIDGYPQRCGQGYAYQIYINFGTSENKSIPQKGWCNSYEETELACLRKLIEIVKERTYFTDIYFDDTNKSMSDLEYELQELSKSLYDFDIKYDIQSYYGPIEKGISLSIFDVDGKYIDTTHHRWGWNIKNFMEDEGDIHTLSISENDYNLNLVNSTQSLLNIILIRLGIITEIVKEKNNG